MKTRPPLLLPVGLVLSLLAVAAQAPLGSDARAEVLKVLEIQQRLWNVGDLRGFMDFYWRSEELTFQSGGGDLLRGWDGLLARYERTYPSGARGVLAFENLDVRPLGPEAAYVLGRFKLTLADGQTKGGAFTLVFRRLREGWRIVHDHTC
jgi:L-asparaginase / beta-aspartyl-peptidase